MRLLALVGVAVLIIYFLTNWFVGLLPRPVAEAVAIASVLLILRDCWRRLKKT